nr:hypothetical protein StreXyl84_03270 [Streptomyces sp. Xyl84]
MAELVPTQVQSRDGSSYVVRLFHRFERFGDEAVGQAVSVPSNFQMTWHQYFLDGVGAARWR